MTTALSLDPAVHSSILTVLITSLWEGKVKIAYERVPLHPSHRFPFSLSPLPAMLFSFLGKFLHLIDTYFPELLFFSYSLERL